MAWQTATYRLTASAPVILHNGQLASPINKFSKALKQISGKRKKTDADHEEMAHIEFLAGLYMGEDGPIIPGDNLEACLINAAKKLREGPVAKSGMIVQEDARLEYNGPRSAEELWADESFRFQKLVRVQSARILRTRPIFHDWHAVVKVEYEDSLVNKPQLDQWMSIAGTQIGLFDWRPRYGRFEVEAL